MQHRNLRSSISLTLATAILCLVAGGLTVAGLALAPGYEPLLLAGMVAAVPVVALSVGRYHGMVFLAFALLGVVRWEPAPSDLLLMLLLVVGVVFGQLPLTQLRGSSLIHALIWALVTLNLVALLAAQQLAYSLRYTAITLYLIGLCYFVRLYVTTAARMRLVLLGYLTAAVTSVALVALDLVGLSPVDDLFIVESRALALFKDANVFAPFLVLPILFLVDELLRPKLIPGRPWLKVGLIVLLSIGVLTAFSRAGWANLAIATLVYLALSAGSLSPRQWARLLLPGAAAAVALAALVVQLGLMDFLLARATPLQSYDAERFGTQAEGIAAGLSNLFGIGPGMLFNAHSLYVRTFAEYGLFGLLALLAALGVLLAGLIRSALREEAPALGLSARVLLACFVGLLLNSLVIDTLHWRSFWLIFGLAWAVIAATPARRHQP